MIKIIQFVYYIMLVKDSLQSREMGYARCYRSGVGMSYYYIMPT